MGHAAALRNYIFGCGFFIRDSCKKERDYAFICISGYTLSESTKKVNYCEFYILIINPTKDFRKIIKSTFYNNIVIPFLLLLNTTCMICATVTLTLPV